MSFLRIWEFTYQQIDDTGAKVKGQNHYVQIICNPFYTAYFTIPHKDRLSILDILQGGKTRTYFFNDEAFTLLKYFRLFKKTKDIKSELLLTLKYPEIPLHNNAAELGARSQVRKRDVSLHTMTEEGTKANDTFSTIVQTAKKLGVSAYEYFNDRVSKSFKMPSLAELIGAKKSSTFSCKDNG
jgi:hypothetical protein